ncbi:MAG: AbrB/MazE/SpoVT family DNA-binding domain-containing protein [Gammaproteobacteria bacterium]|nr:AbrB/MazE/SpoVT family DNA-binding domain-containing protein [Gammaproteobacteria bacterium]
MQNSTLTSKGQVTIPADVRRRLGLHPGDHVGFIVDGDEVRLVRKERRIEAAFGICKTGTSVSLEDMERIIKQRAQS